MSIPVSGRNLTVIARNNTDGLYYSGYIRPTSHVPDNEGTKDVYHVQFYSITHQDVSRNHVIVVGGATPWPELKVGDFVLTKARCKTALIECYVPGIVVGIPIDNHIQHRFFAVRLHNGQTTHKQRSCIIKIGPDRYRDILDYLACIRYRVSLLKIREQKLLRPRIQPNSSTGYSRRRIRQTNTLLIATYGHRPRRFPRRRRHSNPECPHTPDTESCQRRQSSRASTPSERFPRRRRHSKPECPQTPDTESCQRRQSSRASTPNERFPRRPDTSDTKTYQSSQSGRSSASSVGTSTSSLRSASRKFTESNRTNVSKVSSRYSVGSARTTPIEIDTVVLATWLDDGWFYFGRIATADIDEDEQTYTVVDANDHREIIKREDIFTDEDHMFEAVQPHDHVIALHPNYVYSYAPAIVTEVYEQGAQVHFYDDAERRLPWSEMYKISSRKYKEYVEYIAERMDKICGKVIARDDTTGIYKPYIAESSDHRTQQIYLTSSNKSYKKQLAIHVFPMVTSTRYNEEAWRYVLAPLDTSCTTYLPARITRINPLRLTYYDGKQKDNVELSQCVYINEDYYKNVSKYLINNFKRG